MEAFPNGICMTFQLTFHCWDHQRWRPIQILTWLACWPLQLGSPQTQTGEWRTSTGRHCCCLLWFPWWANREGEKGRGGGVKDVLHWVQTLCHWSEHISIWHAASDSPGQSWSYRSHLHWGGPQDMRRSSADNQEWWWLQVARHKHFKQQHNRLMCIGGLCVHSRLDQESVVFFQHGNEVNALFSWFN